MTSWFTYDFGYSWPYTSGHLIVFVLAILAVALAAWRRRLGWAAVGVVVAAWGLFGAYVMLSVIQLNSPLRMPTSTFAPSGRVLDLGAGSGRATVGVALAHPQVSVAAIDIYEGYWGIDVNSPERLLVNARTAGVDGRVTVETGDMRKLPFGAATFDAAISVAAMDHLSWPDIDTSLREAARVVKPGGQLLLVSLNSDWWVRLAIPVALHGHGYWGASQNVARWRRALDEAGFDLIEVGTRPATLYLVASRSRSGPPKSAALRAEP
jgi:SAM-dependent methyltransferase